MFWNDPHMYGATFPYKDIPTPVQFPIAGQTQAWQNLPRFMPNYYGYVPPVYDPRVVAFDPFLARGIWREPIQPQLPIQAQLPFQTQLPFQMQLPFNMNLPYNVNVPFYGFQRPFC